MNYDVQLASPASAVMLVFCGRNQLPRRSSVTAGDVLPGGLSLRATHLFAKSGLTRWQAMQATVQLISGEILEICL